MAFWKKAFLSLLLLFVACFDASIYIVASHSYRSNLENARSRAYGEAGFIKRAAERDLQAIWDRNGDTAEYVHSLFTSYVEHSVNQQILISFSQGGNAICSSLPEGWRAQLSPVDGRLVSRVVAFDGKRYMAVCTVIRSPSQVYALVLAHDMSDLTARYAWLMRFLVMLAGTVTMALAVGLYAILRRLARPIEMLDVATERIARGEYAMRVPVRGKDEFASLAEHFNSMADDIEERIGELERIAERKQRFVDNLAHELRTPLTTIRGYAEYLRSANIDEDDRLASVDHILSEATRMQEMAFKLLDLSMMRRAHLSAETIDMPRLFTDVAASMRPRLEGRGIALAMDCRCEAIHGDRVLIRSLLLNLLDNAAKASVEGATIALVGKRCGNAVVCEVIDHGKGIPPAHIERMGEPFYRNDAARSRLEGGAGLGLALCREIVALHRASMEISSVEGEGTTVKIAFATS